MAVVVLTSQKWIENQCQSCGTEVKYLFTDLETKVCKSRVRCAAYAYKFVTCPVCKSQIRHDNIKKFAL